MGRLSVQPLGRRAATISLLLLAGVGAGGCSHQSQSDTQKKWAPARPEESFNRILGHLKRLLEQRPQQVFKSPGLEPDSGEMSHFTYQDEVTGELIEPSSEGDPLLARIVIRTRSNYVYTRPDEPEEEEPEKPSSSLDLLGDGEVAAEPGESLPPLPEIELPGESSTGNQPTSRTEGDEDPSRTVTKENPLRTSQEYFLAYEDGKWVLQSEVKEESVKLIFEYALGDQ